MFTKDISNYFLIIVFTLINFSVFSQNHEIDSLKNFHKILLLEREAYIDSFNKLNTFYHNELAKNIKNKDSLDRIFRLKKTEISLYKKQISESLGYNRKATLKAINRLFFNGNHNIIKLNILQLVTNEISIYYERKFKNRLAAEFSAGYIYNTEYFKTPSIRNIVEDFAMPDSRKHEAFENSGIVLRIMPKYYFNRNLYIGLSGIYKNISYKNREIILEYEFFDTNHYELRSDKYNIAGLSLFFGTQTIRYKRLYSDFFIGVGFRYKKGKETIIDEYYKSETKVYNYSNYLGSFPYTRNISSIYPAVNFGIKFSYIFYSKEKNKN